jgi:hypothetical protein
MQRVVKKFESWKRSEEADRAYYRSLTPEQRLDILLDLIARYRDGLEDEDETAQRLARVCRVTQRQRG